MVPSDLENQVVCHGQADEINGFPVHLNSMIQLNESKDYLSDR